MDPAQQFHLLNNPDLREPEMTNNLTWKKYYPLSDKNGFICLVDKMGDDSSIVQAARVSYGKDEQDTLFNIALDCVQQQYPEATDVTGDIDYPESSITVWKHTEVLYEGPNKWSKQYNDKASARMNKDRQLIRYLMNHSHTTPFEMVEFKFMVQVPMDCWRQWIRHRTASVNEYSTRYTEALDMQQTTPENEWRLQATNNKQGSSGYLEKWPDQAKIERDYSSDSEGLPTEVQIITIDERFIITEPGQNPGQYLSEREKEFQAKAVNLYQERLALGIAKEQARKDLPLSTYTRAYWKCDLHNIFNFLRLRMDSHAQLEIRSYANCMYEIVKQVCPVACEAFEDYVLHAKKFSRMEMEIIRHLLIVATQRTEAINEFGYDEAESTEENQRMWNLHFQAAIKEISEKPDNMTDREWKEFLDKLS